jgi:hypothetical protein
MTVEIPVHALYTAGYPTRQIDAKYHLRSRSCNIPDEILAVDNNVRTVNFAFSLDKSLTKKFK